MPCFARWSRLPLALACAVLLVFSGCEQSPPATEPSADRSHAEQAASSSEPEAASTDEAGPGEMQIVRADKEPPPQLDVPTEPEPAQAPPAEPPAPVPVADVPLPLDNVDTADITMPEVVLTEQHAAMSNVKVGDRFPNLELPNLAGEKRSLTELLGPKLTVVTFWNARQTTGLEELSDLSRYFAPRFGSDGLAIVAVNTGDDVQLASELAKEATARFPVLSDADGQALHSVATAKLPRTYLLDPSGNVLWFDLEYSPTTRRDLVRAIRYQLAH